MKVQWLAVAVFGFACWDRSPSESGGTAQTSVAGLTFGGNGACENESPLMDGTTLQVSSRIDATLDFRDGQVGTRNVFFHGHGCVDDTRVAEIIFSGELMADSPEGAAIPVTLRMQTGTFTYSASAESLESRYFIDAHGFSREHLDGLSHPFPVVEEKRVLKAFFVLKDGLRHLCHAKDCSADSDRFELPFLVRR